MVFLLPGVLFRRSFFSGKFNNQFHSGNSIERIFWNILLSFFSLSTFFYLLEFINTSNFIPIKIEVGFVRDDIIEMFSNLYENKIPLRLKKAEFLFSCFGVISSIYVYSIIFGFFLNKLIFTWGLHKSFSFLRFQNNWDYLTTSNKRNNENHTLGDIYSTKVDIKTKDGTLFTGKLYETLFCNDDEDIYLQLNLN